MLPRPVIHSLQNPWIKSLLKLQRTKARREENRFLVEGTHLVEEALGTRWPIEAICFTQAWASRHRRLLDLAASPVVRQEIGPEILAKLATTESPDGVIAVALFDHHSHPRDLAIGTLSIAVESLQDPGNLGSLTRVAAAADVHGVFISADSVDPTNSKVLRSSAGQWFRKPPQVVDLEELVAACMGTGAQVLAAEARGQSFWNLDLTLPTLFVLGNEGNGLSPKLRRQIGHSVAIPMAEGVESLNVAMTAGVLLFEAIRQRTNSEQNV